MHYNSLTVILDANSINIWLRSWWLYTLVLCRRCVPMDVSLLDIWSCDESSSCPDVAFSQTTSTTQLMCCRSPFLLFLQGDTARGCSRWCVSTAGAAVLARWQDQQHVSSRHSVDADLKLLYDYVEWTWVGAECIVSFGQRCKPTTTLRIGTVIWTTEPFGVSCSCTCSFRCCTVKHPSCHFRSSWWTRGKLQRRCRYNYFTCLPIY